MIRIAGRLAAAIALAVALATALPATAEEQWQRVRSTADNFQIMFPGKPVFKAIPGEAGQPAQDNWRYDIGDESSYQVSVFTFALGKLPAVPDLAFYAGVTQAYAGGATCTLRRQTRTTIAGNIAVEGVCDGTKDSFHHLLDMVVVGNRLYGIVSVGPAGHETSAAALRFRNSFKLIK